MWHAQALEASARFLPSECPLVAHVITNYQKHHSPALTTIPEDDVLEEDLRVVRPLNEVKNDNINYYQIIRNHVRAEKKVPAMPPKNLIRPNKESFIPQPSAPPELEKPPEHPNNIDDADIEEDLDELVELADIGSSP